MSIIIIPDSEGRIKTVQALLNKIPKGRVIFLGDLVDRGSNPKALIQFIIDNNHESLMGNHEQLFIDYYQNQDPLSKQLYEQSGGDTTLKSYFNDPIIKDHIEWLKNRPYYIETKDLILTHAPLEENSTLKDGKIYINGKEDFEACWNRNEPKRMNRLQIFGHISQEEVKFYDDFAIGLDTLQGGYLTALHYPSMNLYQQELLD